MKNRIGLLIAVVACFSLQQAAQAECPQLCGDKFNTAFGGALPGDTTGVENTAIGTEAMQLTTTGSQNTAVGSFALLGTNGSGNVAIGDKAIANTVKGDDNVAVGYGALSYVSGSHNIGIGTVAGVRLTYGSYNIDLENHGMPNDAHTIRIGNGLHHRTFISGISSVTVPDGVPVVINSDGQLGVMTSSARCKEAIKPMKNASEAILSLQPVTFRYKKQLDPHATPQFGLVAEEVAKIDPDLVARDESGKPYTVAMRR